MAGVKSDVKLWTPFIASGGHVIFHDVVEKKKELTIVIEKLKTQGYREADIADSMLCIQKL